MTLYTRSVVDGVPVFTLLSAQDEATVRATVVANGSSGQLLFIDGSYECALSLAASDARRAEWVTAAAARATYVPPVVSNFQFRKALRAAGFGTNFKNYVLGLDDTGQEYWQFAPRIKRSSAEVEAARVALSRTQAQIDTIFRSAATFAE